MGKAIWFFLSVLLSFQAKAATSPPSFAEVEASKKRLVKILGDSGYFKSGSCQDVANTVLDSFGLPTLGSFDDGVALRGRFNRSNKNYNLPTFSDSIVEQDLVSEIQASAKGKVWQISISRTLLKGKQTDQLLGTKLVFTQEQKNGSQVCDWESLDFSLPSDSGTKTYATKDCLDLFLLESGSPSEAGTYSGRMLSWLRKDCATALRYSKQAKITLQAVEVKK